MSNYGSLSSLGCTIDVTTVTNSTYKPPPAYTILFLAIGLLEFDGLFILIGYGMTVALTIFSEGVTSTPETGSLTGLAATE